MCDEYYMNIALKEAKKAFDKGEIPVGAIIVENDIIISKAHNLRDNSKIVTKHAEILAIEKANRKKKDWRLANCTLYTTLQPCKMCQGAIIQARIKKVIYGTESFREENTAAIISKIKNHNIAGDCKAIIDTFFKDIRIK